MNKLQNLTSELPLLVTLNSDHQADPHLTHDQWRTQHPLFDQPAIDAQAKLASIQGKNHTYYCGAWLRYGFHEDGLASAVDVAAQLGCEPPWQRASTATSVERIH